MSIWEQLHLLIELNVLRDVLTVDTEQADAWEQMIISFSVLEFSLDFPFVIMNCKMDPGTSFRYDLKVPTYSLVAM